MTEYGLDVLTLKRNKRNLVALWFVLCISQREVWV